MEIKGSKILITGGSLGIGKATCKLLIEKGAGVIITGRDKNRIKKAADETGAIPFTADVSCEKDVMATYEFIEDEWGGLDCLVNNAGIGGDRKLMIENTTADFEEVYKVNIYGASMMAREAAKIFIEQKSGNIINIASTAALKGYPQTSVYASSKFALRGLTQCWQTELRKYNMRVMLINPSEVTTAFGSPDRIERTEITNKLRSHEIAHSIVTALEMDDRGFIPELTVFATNPW